MERLKNGKNRGTNALPSAPGEGDGVRAQPAPTRILSKNMLSPTLTKQGSDKLRSRAQVGDANIQEGLMKTRIPRRFLLLVLAALVAPSITIAQNVRLTNDTGGGYVSTYTLATGTSYTDAVLTECSIARGRQNEPAVAVDPRNTNVLLGSSNDYCGVYAFTPAPQTPSPTGPIWLGYYRSEDGGTTFRSSLVPGYPGDASP